MKFRVYSNTACSHITVEATVISTDEFSNIRYNEITPDFIFIEDKGILVYNEFTCTNGYHGTCNCTTHERKVWRKYDLQADCWGEKI